MLRIQGPNGNACRHWELPVMEARPRAFLAKESRRNRIRDRAGDCGHSCTERTVRVHEVKHASGWWKWPMKSARSAPMPKLAPLQLGQWWPLASPPQRAPGCALLERMADVEPSRPPPDGLRSRASSGWRGNRRRPPNAVGRTVPTPTPDGRVPVANFNTDGHLADDGRPGSHHLPTPSRSGSEGGPFLRPARLQVNARSRKRRNVHRISGHRVGRGALNYASRPAVDGPALSTDRSVANWQTSLS